MIMATVAAVVGVSAGKRFLLLGATSYYSDLSADKLVCSASAGDLPTNTNTSTSIITANAKKSRRPHSVKALKDPHSPCSLIHDNYPDEYLVDALLLLQKSMLEKQWNLAPETQTQTQTLTQKKKKKSEIDEITCSGTSARRRRMESRRIRGVESRRIRGGADDCDDDDEMMIPQWRRRRRRSDEDGVGLLLLPPHQKGGGGGGYYVSQQLLTHGEVVRLSHKIKAGLALEERRSRLKQRLGCEPSDEQLASSLRMSRASLQSRMIECSLAREKLAMSNVRLVMSIAQRYDNMGAQMPDLIQGGLIGLLRGIEKFDSSKGFKISTYVYWWIRQGVSRALVESSRTLRLPTHLHERLSLIRNAKARLEERGITPSIDRIAESLNMTERKVRNATEAVSKVFSLDREAYPSLNGLPGETLHSYIADTHAENNPWTGVGEWALKDEVDKLINATLREREREIIRLYYGLDNECLTWEDISRRIGLSRERVRQVGLVALEKLKHAARKSGLEAMLQQH